MDDARVLVAVADEKGAVRQHRDIGGKIEVRVIRAGNACLTKRAEDLAFRRALEDLMKSDIGEPQRAVRADA